MHEAKENHEAAASPGPFRPAGIGRWRLALLGISLIILFVHMEHFRFIVDDTYITLRYSRNLATGQGLVFNPGERVEGYTNFLWVVILAGLMKLGLNGVVAARYVGLAFAAGTLALTGLFPYLIEGRPRPLDWAAALLLSLNGSFAVWAGAGLENGMFGFMVMSGVTLFLRRVGPASAKRGLIWGLCFAAAYLLRPDGGLFFAVAVLLRVGSFRQCPLKARLTEVLAAGAAFGAPLLAHLSFRFWYYGDILPNTFYVKVGTAPVQLWWGLSYTLDFLRTYSWLLPAPAALLFVLRKQLRWETALAGFGLVYAGYVVAVGGDGVFPYFRFFMAILPLLYILVARGLGELWSVLRQTSPRRAAVAPAGFILAVAFVSVQASHQGSHAHEVQVINTTTEENIKIGNWLRSAFPPDTLIATNAAGTIPYYSNFPAIDLLGLADRHIARTKVTSDGRMPAHEKHDFRYVLERRPALIFYWKMLFDQPPVDLGIEQVLGGRLGFQDLADPEIRQEFAREYRLRIFPVGDMFVAPFVRKDLVPDPPQ
jgi:arabinofuranosyltransferase